MKLLLCVILVIVWLYLLHALERAELRFWKFMVGSAGLFIILMVVARPLFTMPLARAVAAIAGVFGQVTNTFTAYFRYGIMFIESSFGAITLQIDFECSGIIEIMAFVSLLSFFKVYTINERIMVGVLGTVSIIIANVLRIIAICEMIYFGGSDVYFVAHTILGRLIFYVLSVMLYFYVFTKPQIIRMKIGKFTYGHS